jgi:pantetheine-phosphate adenylyltransferase
MYPGTFDPITRGHEDLIRRCVRLFDQVVVAIASNPKKAPLFTLDERVALAKEVLRDLPEVSVTGYTGLTVEFARANGFKAIIRGLRAISDFEYEFQLAMMNRHLIDGVETVFLTPSEHHTFISSSLVREIAEFNGDVSAFVHPVVGERLKQKLGNAMPQARSLRLHAFFWRSALSAGQPAAPTRAERSSSCRRIQCLRGRLRILRAGGAPSTPRSRCSSC